eukprot:m.6566 g.6566  ORF g.6566 m.6566 type:complete len:123 (-) comp2614_c0_seq2:101-469(-)
MTRNAPSRVCHGNEECPSPFLFSFNSIPTKPVNTNVRLFTTTEAVERELEISAKEKNREPHWFTPNGTTNLHLETKNLSFFHKLPSTCAIPEAPCLMNGLVAPQQIAAHKIHNKVHPSPPPI